MLKKIPFFNKKSQDFYLELKEDQSTPDTDSKTAVTTQPTQPKVETDKSPATASKIGSNKGNKTEQKQAQDISQEPSVKEVPQAAPTVDRIEQLIIDAVYKNNGSKNGSKADVQPEDSISNFATAYLISPPAPNRRPGASLNKFKEMSRNMKSVAKIQAKQ